MDKNEGKRESLSHKISFNHSRRLTFAYSLFILSTHYFAIINYLSKVVSHIKKSKLGQVRRYSNIMHIVMVSLLKGWLYNTFEL